MFKSAKQNAGQNSLNKIGNKSLEIVVNIKELETTLCNKNGVKEEIRNKIWRMPAHIRGEHKLRFVRNSVLQWTFVRKRECVERKLHVQELYGVHSSSNIFGMIRSREVRRTGL